MLQLHGLPTGEASGFWAVNSMHHDHFDDWVEICHSGHFSVDVGSRASKIYQKGLLMRACHVYFDLLSYGGQPFLGSPRFASGSHLPNTTFPLAMVTKRLNVASLRVPLSQMVS